MISRPTSVGEVKMALELEAYEAKKPIEKDDPFYCKKDDSFYYKKHSEHARCEKSVAGAKEIAKQKPEALEAAPVTEEEGNKALLKDAESEDVESMRQEDAAVEAAEGSTLKSEVETEDPWAAGLTGGINFDAKDCFGGAMVASIMNYLGGIQ